MSAIGALTPEPRLKARLQATCLFKVFPGTTSNGTRGELVEICCNNSYIAAASSNFNMYNVAKHKKNVAVVTLDGIFRCLWACFSFLIGSSTFKEYELGKLKDLYKYLNNRRNVFTLFGTYVK